MVVLRAVWPLGALLMVACSIGEPTKACRVDGDCNAGHVCVMGTCASSRPPFDASCARDGCSMEDSSVDATSDLSVEADVEDAGADVTSDQMVSPDARPASGTILWARSTSSLYLDGIAEGSGGVAITGALHAPADLVGALLFPRGIADTVLAQFTTDSGAYEYSAQFGGGGSVYGFLEVVDPYSAPLVFGLSYGDVDLGNGVTPGGGGTGTDAFLGRYLPTGKPQWVKRLVGPGMDQFTSVANGPNNAIFVAGWYDETTVFDGSYTFTGAGDRDILLLCLDYDGNVMMKETFATSNFEEATSIAWTGTSLVVAGSFQRATTIGRFEPSAPGFGVWVGKFSENGAPSWVVGFGSGEKNPTTAMTVDSAGNIYVTGRFTTTITFGPYTLLGSRDEIFVAKLRGDDGAVVWATSFGSSGDDIQDSIAVDGMGRLLVSATVAGPIDDGGSFAGGTDVALVSYDANGMRRWAKVLGTIGTDGPAGVRRGTDAFYAGVNFGSDIGPSLDGVPIIGAPRPSSLLLKLQP